jgi:alpha-ribazole phosphatase
MKIVLVRHPPPDVRPGVCYGRLDVPLHPASATAAGRLAATIARCGISGIRTSPSQRCRVLADAVGELCGVPPVVDARLQELDFGAWEGLPWDDVPRAALDAWAASPMGFAPPGGESGASLVARVRAVRDDLSQAGEDCLIVSHGGPLKVLGALLRGEVPDLLAPPPPLGSATNFTL